MSKNAWLLFGKILLITTIVTTIIFKVLKDMCDPG
jgi:hypothetical protein